MQIFSQNAGLIS